MIRHILAGSIRLLVPRAPLVLAKTPAAASDDARGTWVILQKVSDSETDRDRDWLVSCVYNATTRPFWHSLQLAAGVCCGHAELVKLQEQTSDSSASFVLEPPADDPAHSASVYWFQERYLCLPKTPAAASDDCTWVIQQKVRATMRQQR